MVKDHVKAQNELLEAAQGAGVQWPKALDAKHAAMKSRLAALSGDAFDRAYMKAMVDGHREVEAVLAARAARPLAAGEGAGDAFSANITKWSGKTLSAVRAHLKKAEDVTRALPAS